MTDQGVTIRGPVASTSTPNGVTASGNISGNTVSASHITANNDLGVGTTSPTHPLHVNENMGIRQNRLYISGGGNGNWSSISYNAYHNAANNSWVFPDPGHTAVTIEMDDSGGAPRFQVWSTTPGNTTGWQERFAIDGNTGNAWVAGDLSFGGILSGKYGDASRAHWAWLFAQNSTTAFDVVLPFAQPFFAFTALSAINHIQVPAAGTGNFASITAVDGKNPFNRPVGDPANSILTGTGRTISFRLQATTNSQAWSIAVVFPQQM